MLDQILTQLHTISIHALREESDKTFAAKRYGIKISIHALREESDFGQAVREPFVTQFQSTLSVRRATRRYAQHLLQASRFQSTLSVRRATMVGTSVPASVVFQSTLSVRRATQRIPKRLKAS